MVCVLNNETKNIRKFLDCANLKNSSKQVSDYQIAFKTMEILSWYIATRKQSV